MDSIDNQINEVTNQLTIIEQLFEKDLSEWKVKEKNKFGNYEELRKERELLRRKEYQLRELLLEKEKQVTEIINQENHNDFYEKDKRLEWAFTHADIESFGYFEPIMVFSNQYSSDIYQPQNSAKIVKEVLLSFRKGESHLIDGFATRQYFRVSRVLIHPNYNQESTRFPEEVMVPAELDFRNKLQKQLHTLIGVMPRIDLLDGKHLIYYL